jgi:hypothetical protein
MSCHFFKGERPRPAGCVTHLAEHSSPLIFQFFVLKIECLTYFKLLPPAKAETTPQELSIVNKFRNYFIFALCFGFTCVLLTIILQGAFQGLSAERFVSKYLVSVPSHLALYLVGLSDAVLWLACLLVFLQFFAIGLVMAFLVFGFKGNKNKDSA